LISKPDRPNKPDLLTAASENIYLSIKFNICFRISRRVR